MCCTYALLCADHTLICRDGTCAWTAISAAPGRDKATLEKFFDLLGADRCAQITHVSADAADWIATVVKVRCPQAVRCADAFYADVLVMPTSGFRGLVACGDGALRSA